MINRFINNSIHRNRRYISFSYIHRSNQPINILNDIMTTNKEAQLIHRKMITSISKGDTDNSSYYASKLAEIVNKNQIKSSSPNLPSQDYNKTELNNIVDKSINKDKHIPLLPLDIVLIDTSVEIPLWSWVPSFLAKYISTEYFLNMEEEDQFYKEITDLYFNNKPIQSNQTTMKHHLYHQKAAIAHSIHTASNTLNLKFDLLLTETNNNQSFAIEEEQFTAFFTSMSNKNSKSNRVSKGDLIERNLQSDSKALSEYANIIIRAEPILLDNIDKTSSIGQDLLKLIQNMLIKRKITKMTYKDVYSLVFEYLSIHHKDLLSMQYSINIKHSLQDVIQISLGNSKLLKGKDAIQRFVDEIMEEVHIFKNKSIKKHTLYPIDHLNKLNYPVVPLPYLLRLRLKRKLY